MDKQIYAISLCSFKRDYEIIECKIIKETDKTFVIERNCMNWTIKKSAMESEYYKYVIGYENAVKTRIECLEEEFNKNSNKIEYLTKRNAELTSFIMDIKGGNL